MVSGTVAAGAVTPVDTATNTAGSPIVIGGGAQSIVVTPNGKTVYVPNGVLNTVTPIRTATNTARPPMTEGLGLLFAPVPKQRNAAVEKREYAPTQGS